MKPLPSSIQYFPRIKSLNCLYVDKTKYAHDLIVQEKSFFLARPRRFGKSLFLSVLDEILRGHKNLFDDLWIGKSDYSWPIHGIIHLDFAPIKSVDAATVDQSLCKMLSRIAHEYHLSISLDSINPNQALIELTDALYEKFGKVAILID